nr:unnamed protein product [Digitaria exilis]
MAMPFARRDIEAAGAGAGNDDSPAAKKGKPELPGAGPALTRSEAFAFAAVLTLFIAGIFCVFLTAPRREFGQILRLPRNLADVRLLKDNLAVYARDYQANFILGYCSIYIFMQTFMIPGTIFMSLLAGALFGVIKGGILVVFTATAGASSCYFVSKLIGRPLAGRALGDLKSVRELYDFKTLVVLFLIGSVAVVPTILKRKRTYE